MNGSTAQTKAQSPASDCERRLCGLADAWERKAETLAFGYYDEDAEEWIEPEAGAEYDCLLLCAEQLRSALGQST